MARNILGILIHSNLALFMPSSIEPQRFNTSNPRARQFHFGVFRDTAGYAPSFFPKID
jgi:hypothetical protein